MVEGVARMRGEVVGTHGRDEGGGREAVANADAERSGSGRSQPAQARQMARRRRVSRRSQEGQAPGCCWCALSLVLVLGRVPLCSRRLRFAGWYPCGRSPVLAAHLVCCTWSGWRSKGTSGAREGYTRYNAAKAAPVNVRESLGVSERVREGQRVPGG